MSLHQYIGARYVPYYYQNSLDPTSTEWEPNVTYEALTVVTLPNQHSYISKKTVPDTIGSPALNAEYWLDQGSRDAYINSLQSQIDTINNTDLPAIDGRLDTLEEWEDVFCIISKQEDNTWIITNDDAHEPKHVTNVSLDTNNRLVIEFDQRFSKCGTSILVPDEANAIRKFTAGCSLGLDKATVMFAQNPLGGTFTFTGNTPTVISGGDIESVSWVSTIGSYGAFNIHFKDYAQGNLAGGASIILGSGGTAGSDATLQFRLRGVGGATPADIQCVPNKDISSLNGSMSVMINKPGEITANKMPYVAGGNWWYYGKMKK